MHSQTVFPIQIRILNNPACGLKHSSDVQIFMLSRQLWMYNNSYCGHNWRSCAIYGYKGLHVHFSTVKQTGTHTPTTPRPTLWHASLLLKFLTIIPRHEHWLWAHWLLITSLAGDDDEYEGWRVVNLIIIITVPSCTFPSCTFCGLWLSTKLWLTCPSYFQT